MNRNMLMLFLATLFLLKPSFAIDRCDVYGVFLEACANFGQKRDFSACSDFENELSNVIKSNNKSTKLFIDACGTACKSGVLNKGLSKFGVEAFVKMCKILK
ncbi:MAG: hypothetical protein ACP5LI_04425 [Hydrogenobaculum sp.]